MGSSIVDNTFGTMLDEVFEQLESLVDLPPFFGGLFCESPIDHGHDLVECLTGWSWLARQLKNGVQWRGSLTS